MRYLTTILALVVFVGLAWGQRINVGDFQDKFWTYEDTLHSTEAADSLTVQFPRNRGKALLMGYIVFDTLNTGANEVPDSLNIRFRQAWWGKDTTFFVGATGTIDIPNLTDEAWTRAAMQNSSGAAQAWTFAQIYDGPSGSLTNFDSTLTLEARNNASGQMGQIPLVFDMDGYPWRYMQIWIDYDALEGVGKDCLYYKLELDID